MKNFNGLSPAETERLAILAEECGEIQQIVGKILRHGYESRNPYGTGVSPEPTNRMLLEKEVGDANFICKLMFKEGDMDVVEVSDRAKKKEKMIKKYLHHN